MKKTFLILGITSMVILLVLGGVIGYGLYKGKQLDATSKEYVDAAVPAIVANWSVQGLKDRASPQLMHKVTQEQLTKFFAFFSRLGKMKKYVGSKGQSYIYITPEQGRTVTARYMARAEFEKGDANIKVLLILNKDRVWKIAGFHVNSPSLIPQ